MNEHVSYDDIMKALEELHDNDIPNVRRTFFVAGTGISDQTAIDYFNGMGIRVLTTDGRIVCNGKLEG